MAHATSLLYHPDNPSNLVIVTSDRERQDRYREGFHLVNLRNVGRRIRSYRKKHKASLDVFAETLTQNGLVLTRSQLNTIEQGRASFNTFTKVHIMQLAQLMGISIGDLVAPKRARFATSTLKHSARAFSKPQAPSNVTYRIRIQVRDETMYAIWVAPSQQHACKALESEVPNCKVLSVESFSEPGLVDVYPES